jgi:hypothetical protein
LSSAGGATVQVAVDGAWERARAVTAGAGTVAAGTVADVLGWAARAAARNVAAEVLWPGKAFVGARWRLDELAAARAGVDAAARLVDDPGDPGTVRERALAALLQQPPGRVLSHIEVGVENAWLSSGPERIWSRDHGSAPEPARFGRRRPDLARSARPIAVEAAADAHRPCWVGVVVSRPHGTGHALDDAKLRARLTQLRPYMAG